MATGLVVVEFVWRHNSPTPKTPVIRKDLGSVATIEIVNAI